MPAFLFDNFFYLFVNNFSALFLCEINDIDISNMVDFFQTFVASRNPKTLINSNYFLGMYVPCIFKPKVIKNIENRRNVIKCSERPGHSGTCIDEADLFY